MSPDFLLAGWGLGMRLVGTWCSECGRLRKRLGCYYDEGYYDEGQVTNQYQKNTEQQKQTPKTYSCKQTNNNIKKILEKPNKRDTKHCPVEEGEKIL